MRSHCRKFEGGEVLEEGLKAFTLFVVWAATAFVYALLYY